MKKTINKLFLFLNSLPWTKPVAIIICFTDIAIFAAAWVTGRDIPQNAADMGKWLGTSIFAISAGKSAYENGSGFVKNSEAESEKAENTI